jgi:hypothetical protein
MAPLIKPNGVSPMKIKLLTSRAAATGSQDRGDIIETDDAEAIRMIKAGQAEPVAEVAVERAVARTKPEKRG